jgi:hypothetical protein
MAVLESAAAVAQEIVPPFGKLAAVKELRPRVHTNAAAVSATFARMSRSMIAHEEVQARLMRLSAKLTQCRTRSARFRNAEFAHDLRDPLTTPDFRIAT